MEELEATMSAEEFYSWIQFYEEEPFGDVRADLRAGIVAATIVRMHGGKTARPKPLDFMPIVRSAVEKARARADPSAELRAGLMLAFQGKGKHVTIKRARAGSEHGR